VQLTAALLGQPIDGRGRLQPPPQRAQCWVALQCEYGAVLLVFAILASPLPGPPTAQYNTDGSVRYSVVFRHIVETEGAEGFIPYDEAEAARFRPGGDFHYPYERIGSAPAEAAAESTASDAQVAPGPLEETIGGATTTKLTIGDKTHVFERGPAELPAQLDAINYANVYKDMMEAGNSYGSVQSSPMTLFGSSIGPCGDPYRYQREDGTHGMLPRLLTASRPGKSAHNVMQQPWLKSFATQMETRALQYAQKNDPQLFDVLLEAQKCIPQELRVCETVFTAMALVGDCKDGFNHEHMDENDVISIFVTLGQGITGGRTLYFDGTELDKQDLSGTRGEQIHAVEFVHGQYQVGPFEEVIHSGEQWKGPRGVMSFYLNRKILDFFRKPNDEGLNLYAANRSRMYGLPAPEIIEADAAEESTTGPPRRKRAELADDAATDECDAQSSDKQPEKKRAARSKKLRPSGWHKKTDAEIEAETDEIMRQINANVIAEGCVFKCTNIIQQRFGEPPFELPQFKRSLRKVVETAVKRRQVKKIFGTNKVGDVMEDEAVISQIKYMLEERYGHGYYTFEAVDPAALVTTGDDDAYYLVQGVLERVTVGDKPGWSHHDPVSRQYHTQLVHVLNGAPGFTDAEVPCSQDDDWMHTIVIKSDKKRFFCHNLMSEWPDDVPIAHLGLGEDGRPKDDGAYYMRSIKRVYKIAPFATEELTRRLEELKEERVRKRLRKK
jgi:hypothetical protein